MSVQTRLLERIRCIDCKAEEFDRQGYSVKADTGSWSRPPVTEGIKLDIRASRGDQEIIGKVLRPDELETCEKDFEKLIKYAGERDNTSFRIYYISEDEKPILHKIF